MLKRKMTALALAIGCTALLAVGCGKKEPQTVKLTVALDPASGYEWIVEQDPELFEVAATPSDDGSEETLTLTPKEAGTSAVSFFYGNSSKEGDYDTRLTYNLKVKKNRTIEMESATSQLGGDISTLPEMPQLEIE